jgi:hypothetical protein
VQHDRGVAPHGSLESARIQRDADGRRRRALEAGWFCFALTAYKIEDETSLQGAFNFAVTNTLGAVLVLLGLAVVYGRTGALNLAQIGHAMHGADAGLVSDLSGQAVFHRVFPDASQHRTPAGLDVEARWRSFGEGLSRLQAEWLSQREWLKRIGHDLRFAIHGPYDELSVTTSVEAAGARVEAELAYGIANLHMNFSGADTSAWFGPALGGRLRGRLLASLRLAPSFAGLAAGIVNADLRLEREAPARGPRTMVLRIGSSLPVPATPGLLSANIAQLRLSKGRLQLQGAQAVWTRLSARAEANIDFNLSDWSGSRLDARGSLAIASLADWIPAPIAQGRLRVVGDVSGTLGALGLQARISPSSALVIGGQHFRLPDRLALQWSESRGLLVPQLRLRTDTGFIGLAGRVDPNHRVEAEILLSRYSLAELPWFAGDSVAGSFGALLSGRLLLEGPVGRPSVRGTISTRSLDFRGSSLGSATVTLTVGESGGDGELRVGPSLAARVNLRYAPHLSIDTRISLHKQALRPWLPPEVAVPSVAASGTAHLVYREGRRWVGDATLEVEGPGLEGVKVAARTQADDMSAAITGQVSLPPWRTFWSRYLIDAQGTMGIQVTARHDPRGTRLSGELLAVQDVTLRPSRRYGPIRFLAGNRLGFDGRSFSSQGLQVELPWFRGRVAGRMTIEPDLSRSLIDAGVTGVLDLGAFPVRLLQPELTLGGRAAIDATVTGSLGASPGPQIHGQVDLEQVRVALPDFPALVIHGRVNAQGEHLSTQALNVEIAHTGRITVGAPKSPATAVLASLLPLRLGQVDAPFWGSNLVIGSPRSPVEIGDLDVNARYHGPPGDRTLSGQVDVSRGSLRPRRARRARATEQRPWYQSLPPGLTLDLEIKGLNHAMEVAIPWVPDVTADFDCRLRATRQGAHWSGRVYGAGLYDRMAFQLYSWFGDKGVLRCQFGAKK